MVFVPEHIPVMPREVEGALNPGEGATVVDCTLGLGGHSRMIAGRIGRTGWLIGMDQDSAALAIAQARLQDFQGRVSLVKKNFSRINEVLGDLKIGSVDGILLDLGVSSLQLDDAQRGFSFLEKGPLDMRMDRDCPLSAAELVNSLSEEELANLIWKYGEERFSRRIARAIVQARARQKISETTQLSDIILRALPRGYQRQRVHPATRTFQALRIVVNQELEALSQAIDTGFPLLARGGRLVVISFHSLEDRIVKEKFRSLARDGRAHILTKKPARPTEEELSANPRSRSARLRALERIE